MFGVTDSGSYLESATNLEAQGYLDTGFVRFDTVEPKQFRYISARLKGQGTASISTVDRNEVETGVVTIDETSTQDYDMGRTVPEEYLGLKFTLNQASATVGPTLTSWQLKALPATNRSRLIQVPVLLFEQMRDSKGTALPTIDVHAVLQALEQLENAAQPILFAELNKKPNRTELVVIDQIQYQQTAPPANLAQGNGGVLVLTLRTVL